MSSISILGGDFEILFDDENNQNGGSAAVAGMRTIQHTGSSETVYTTNQLYSAVADAADEFVAMGFRNPMLPVTPNAYTMENQYFIPRSSTQYLKEGAITADWSLTGTVTGDGVVKVGYVIGAGSNFASTDIGSQITQTGTGHTGTLLDFDIDQDGSLAAWIRPDDPATDTFSGTGALTAESANGPDTSVAGVNGEHVFSAIQAIGSVPTATEVYLIQDRAKVASWDGSFQWWATDADASLGIISILIQVKDSGTLIADGDVEVFARRYSALYDNFRLNVAGGGFSALPLASAPDINNTTGYRTFTGDTLTGTGTFTVGNGIYDASAGSFANATKKGVITAVSGTTTEPVIEYYLVGDLTDFVASDTIQEYDYSTGLDGDADIAGAGILAPSNTSGGPADTSAGEGGSVTITLAHADVDHDGDGTPEPYSVTVDCQSDVPIAKVYEHIKYVCRRGQDNSFWDTNSSNIPGETYRGLDTFVEFDGAVGGAMTDGEDITGQNGYTARLAGYSTSVAWASAADYITLSDSQTSLDSIIDNDTLSGVTSGNTVEARTTGGGGTYGIISFTSPKASPFGTFTGSQIFGARGVAFTNPDSADVQAYILTDDVGTLNTPPNTVSFTVTNTAADDRILVARDTGTSGIIDKDQFGGMTAASTGDSTLTVGDGSFNEQIPPIGFVRVVDTSPALSRLGNTDTQQEHRYEYSSRAGGTGVFTLTAVDNATGTATGGSTTTLLDSGGGFQGTVPVKVGMLVRNTTDGGIFEVTEVTSDTALAVQQLYGTAGGDFANLDGYEINRVITAYTTDDDVYDLILDLEATGTSVTNSFTKTLSSNFGVVVNVRQGKVILPFTLNQTQGDGSTTVTVVRQPDNIAT